MFIIPSVYAFRARVDRNVYAFPAATPDDAPVPAAQVLWRHARDLRALFARNLWRWSGEVPTDTDIWGRLDALLSDALGTLAADASRDVATVSGGRLAVEARRAGTDGLGASVTVLVSFTADSL